MSVLLKKNPYYWIDSAQHYAAENLCQNFKAMLSHKPRTSDGLHPLVFLCVGTPLIAGDSLGPMIGTALCQNGVPNVYGTLTRPVHAENIEIYRRIIKKRYHRPTIIAIDAAIGTKAQEGLITIRHAPLCPGSGLGKKISPIGNIAVTGIFEDIEKKSCLHLAGFLSRIIADGILSFLSSSSF